MKQDYDIFERFDDGSTIWRSYVCGEYEAQRKIAEFSERSKNEFYAINLKEDRPLAFDLARIRSQEQMKTSLKRTA
jgi:hypothetical protein